MDVVACFRCSLVLLASATHCPLCHTLIPKQINDEPHAENRCLICNRLCRGRYCSSSCRVNAHYKYKKDPENHPHLAPEKPPVPGHADAVAMYRSARMHCDPLPSFVTAATQRLTDNELTAIAIEGDDQQWGTANLYRQATKTLGADAADPLVYLSFRAQKALPLTDFIERLIERFDWTPNKNITFPETAPVTIHMNDCVCSVCDTRFQSPNTQADICPRCTDA